MMNVEKLKRLQKQVRIGGKGTPRRKKKITHQTAAADDKKLQSSLKKLSVSTIPGIEEVNIIKDDLTVIHFNNPKAQASLSANTFAVAGHGDMKKVVEMLPEILPQLGQETVAQLRMFASSMTSNQRIDNSEKEEIKSNVLIKDNHDDLPMLVSDFDEIATIENLKTKSHKNEPIEENSLQSNVAQDMMIKITDANDGKNKLNSDAYREENTFIDSSNCLNVETHDESVIVTKSSDNKSRIQKEESLNIERNSDVLPKDKKHAIKPIAEKKYKSSKRSFDSEKADKNIRDEVILSELKGINPIDLKSKANLQDQTERKQSIKELKEDILKYNYIGPIAENEKENAEENIVAENESLNHSAKMEIESKDESCTTNSISFVLNRAENLLDMNLNLTPEKIETQQELQEKNIGTKITQESNQHAENVKYTNKCMIAQDISNLILPIDIDDASHTGEVDLNQINFVEQNNLLIQNLEEPSIDLGPELTEVGDMKEYLSTKNMITNRDINNLYQEKEMLQKLPEKIGFINFPQNIKKEEHKTEDFAIESKIQNKSQRTSLLQSPGKTVCKLATVIQVTNTEDFQTNDFTKDNKLCNKQEGTSERTKMLQNFPGESGPNLATALQVTNIEDFQKVDTAKENKKYETSNIIVLPQFKKTDDEQTTHVEKENKIQNEIQRIKMLLKSPVGADSDLATFLQDTNTRDFQTKSDTIKILKPDLQTIDDSTINETKADEINRNESNHKLLKTRNLSAEIPLKADIDKKSQQADKLKNNETLLVLGPHKEKENTLAECGARRENENEPIVKLFGATKVISLSERESKMRIASPCLGKNDCAKPEKVTTKQNEMIKKSSSETTTKPSVDSKKTEKSKQTKNQKHQTSENKTKVSSVQHLLKLSPSSAVKLEKQTDAQKSKKQRTSSPKAQHTTEVKSGNATQKPAQQKILASTKSLTDMSIKTATSGTEMHQKIIQTPEEVDIPKKSMTSTQVIKTVTRTGATETHIKVPSKSDQISASMDTIQKQANQKAKHPRTTPVKAEVISKPLPLPKSKPSQKSAVNANKNTS